MPPSTSASQAGICHVRTARAMKSTDTALGSLVGARCVLAPQWLNSVIYSAPETMEGIRRCYEQPNKYNKDECLATTAP